MSAPSLIEVDKMAPTLAGWCGYLSGQPIACAFVARPVLGIAFIFGGRSYSVVDLKPHPVLPRR